MFKFLAPPPDKERLSEDKIDPAYKKLRLQVFLGIFVGYAGYYLVRNNLSQVKPDLIKEGFSFTEIGIAGAMLPLAYGISKFIMGNVSDRSNARIFMPLGLILSILTMMILGFVPIATSSLIVLSILLLLNG